MAKHKKTTHFKNALKVSVVLVLILLFLMSPVFEVKTITVTGNEKYSIAEICRDAGISEGLNMFLVNKRSAKQKLNADHYIKTATIKLNFPSEINVEIFERKVIGYVPYLGTYLYIDEEGLVLDSQTYFIEEHPVITGLKFEEFKLGEPLKVENEEALKVVVNMVQLLIKYDLLDAYSELDVSDTQDIKLYHDEICILFGDMQNSDYKIRTATEALKAVDGYRGYLNIKSIDNPYFTFLS